MPDEEIVTPETPNEPVLETVETPAIETPAEAEVDVAQLQTTNKKLFERAKNAEAEVKRLKAQPTQTSPQNVEEVVLQASGMSEELLEKLKTVASVQKTTLIKAQSDPIFVAIKEKFEKDQKTKDASIGASRSSGTMKPKKDFKSTGLTREEHMAMVKNL